MGTRADFYVGRGEKAEWVGSIAMDGVPVLLASGEEGQAPIVPAHVGRSPVDLLERVALSEEEQTLVAVQVLDVEVGHVLSSGWWAIRVSNPADPDGHWLYRPVGLLSRLIALTPFVPRTSCSAAVVPSPPAAGCPR